MRYVQERDGATNARMGLGSAWGSPLVFLIGCRAIECLADKGYSRCRASAIKARARAFTLRVMNHLQG
ncbi:MAG: hypothetical protein C0439_17720 [Pseudomonas sp.]|nr:hypothetical protein [Pseudomonas sp.]